MSDYLSLTIEEYYGKEEHSDFMKLVESKTGIINACSLTRLTPDYIRLCYRTTDDRYEEIVDMVDRTRKICLLVVDYTCTKNYRHMFDSKYDKYRVIESVLPDIIDFSFVMAYYGMIEGKGGRVGVMNIDDLRITDLTKAMLKDLYILRDYGDSYYGLDDNYRLLRNTDTIGDTSCWKDDFHLKLTPEELSNLPEMNSVLLPTLSTCAGAEDLLLRLLKKKKIK